MFRKKTKNINGKAFNMIRNRYGAKKCENIFLGIANLNSIAQYVIQVKNGIIKHVNVNVKFIISAKKIIVGILAHEFVRIASI